MGVPLPVSPVPTSSPVQGHQKRKKRRWAPQHLGQAGLCSARSYMEEGRQKSWTVSEGKMGRGGDIHGDLGEALKELFGSHGPLS